MLTKNSISKDCGVLAGLGVTHQAFAKFSITNLGKLVHSNLAFSSVWQIKKVFHGKILALVCMMSSNHLFF
jgi:hypothetical protein